MSRRSVLVVAAALLCIGGVGRALAASGGSARLVEKPLVLPGVQVRAGVDPSKEGRRACTAVHTAADVLQMMVI